MSGREVVNNRHSVRAFMPEPIESEKLQQILEAVNRAPSAGNLQGYEIYVVTNAAKKRALARAALEQD
ncbi:MAG: nitroreductase family protein, partial [Anaerolineae bacterium]